MNGITEAQEAFCKLLDIEYEIVLGRKNKSVILRIEFQKSHFFHIAGLQYLKDLPKLLFSTEEIFDQLKSNEITSQYIESSSFYESVKERIHYAAFLEQIFDSNRTIFKYNSSLQAFSVIEADFLMKTMTENKNIFSFIAKNQTGKYFCKSFFPEDKKDYSFAQTNWTLLFKKKIHKSTGIEEILFQHKNFTH